MRYLMLFIILILTNNLSIADTLKNEDAARNLVKSMMSHIKAGDVVKGLELARPYTALSEFQFNGAIKIYKTSTARITKKFGKTIGGEFIQVKKLGKSLMYISYLQKFEKNFLRWKFYFYMPVNGWVLRTFNYDDTMRVMLRN